MSLRAKRGNLVAIATGSSTMVAKWASVIFEGVLKDDRLEQQRRRTQREIRRGERARERAQHYRRCAEHERERSGEPRESVDQVIADIHRLRAEYAAAAKALIQRLEELNGGAPPEVAPD